MLSRLCLLLALLELIAPLRAQTDGPVKMTPEFCFTFPVTNSGKDVTVKFPILTNPATVLKPGMVLRVMYILTTANADGSTDLALAHKGNLAQSYSRPTLNPGEQSNMPPEVAHEIEGYRRTVWQVPNNFVMAMAQYPTDALHLMYTPTGRTQDLDDTRFSFFDGLMVGLPGGKVTVLAVEKESRAEAAGLKAGDEILAVGSISTQHDLATFAKAYATTKDAAKENEGTTYSMTIRSEGQAEPRTVNIPMPLSLKNGLMHGI